MKTNRRGFFKVLGAGAVGAAVVKPGKAEKKSEWIPVIDDEPREYVLQTTYASAASTLVRWDDVPIEVSGDDE